jgi:hypothetical protein
MLHVAVAVASDVRRTTPATRTAQTIAQVKAVLRRLPATSPSRARSSARETAVMWVRGTDHAPTRRMTAGPRFQVSDSEVNQDPGHGAIVHDHPVDISQPATWLRDTT